MGFRSLRGIALMLWLVVPPAAGQAAGAAAVPILAYHRFGPTVADGMTVTTATFEAQLRFLAEQGRPVIPLRALVDHRLGRAPAPPAGAVVLTADDGHRSVYTEMFPLVRRFAVPVTLFVYPSAVGRADYALTWEQLRELHASDLFEVQAHTFWHPNFRTERRRLTSAELARFVAMQLERPREILAREVAGPIDLLAWPYGIYDADLIAAAVRAGYVAGVTLDGRPATAADQLLALPRYLVVDRHRGNAFARLLAVDVRPPAREP